MTLKQWLFAVAICLSSTAAFSQPCSYNVTLTSKGAVCLQNDTLTFHGAYRGSQITWYRNGDSVAVSTLAPQFIAGRKTGNGSGITPSMLNTPYGIFIDRSGNLFIADNNNQRIQKWAPGATEGVTVAGGYLSDDPVPAAMKISDPRGVWGDTLGNIYVPDILGVKKWAPGATSGVTIISNNGAGLGEVTGNLAGIYVTKSGTVYVCDPANYRVQKWTPGAVIGITVAGGNDFGTADNQVSYPFGVFVDELNGAVYVSDVFNHRVQKWLPGAATGITVAGGNGPGNAANQLNSPQGIFCTPDGAVYVADAGNYRVQKWLPGAVSGSTVAGGNGIGNGANQVECNYIWVDNNQNIYVCDPANNRIQKWHEGDATGVTVAGSTVGSAPYNLVPADAIADKDGNIYISDTKTNSVIKYAPGSSAGITVAGGNGAGNAANQFDNPLDIFIDSSNTLYVCDRNNYRVQKWPAGATEGITVAGGNGRGANANQLDYPAGVFVNAAGEIFVSDYSNSRVQKWLPGAVQGITVAGGNGRGSNANQLYFPDDVFADATGSLYIADAWNYRVQKWTPGALTGITVAGGTSLPGTTARKLSQPRSVFVDDSANIFIADYQNHRIQKWHEGDDSAVTVAGNVRYYGSLNDQMLQPMNVFKDKSGNLLVVDGYNGRVQKWMAVPDSTFITMSPGNYTATITGRNPVCTATSNTVTVNTGYTYQFIGNGNWSLASNWYGNNPPPSTLPACSKIIVSPPAGSTCILDTPQTISAGANITVVTGSNFIINGNLTIQ